MIISRPPSGPVAGFELRFDSLYIEGRGLAFPCNAAGQVDLDALSERARSNYLYARAVIGREFRLPAVHRQGPEAPSSAQA